MDKEGRAFRGSLVYVLKITVNLWKVGNDEKEEYDGITKLHFKLRDGRNYLDKGYRSGNSRISAMIPRTDLIPLYFWCRQEVVFLKERVITARLCLMIIAAQY